MTVTEARPVHAPLRLVLADRGDPLAGPMTTAMRDRFDVVDRLGVELSASERLLVAALTFRPRRRAWAERFHKSELAVTRRSRRARAGLATVGDHADVVFQTHGLFETPDPRTVLYLDCTHRQAMAHWPAWNPLRGRALSRWLERERRQYHRAAHVFAFHAGTARSVVEDYGVPADRVTTVGAGVSLERLPAPPRHDDAPPTVLFVGNDFERKGGPELLRAFALVRRRMPSARLRLVGTPGQAPAQDGVERLGRVHDRSALSRLYAGADVFCLPSHFDPFPGALLEAMAHGLPCVVTPTGGVPEMVVDGATAVVVEDDDALVTTLARALERLLLDPGERRRLGDGGRRRVEEQFCWPSVLDRMTPALERLRGTDPPTGTTPGTTTTRGARP